MKHLLRQLQRRSCRDRDSREIEDVRDRGIQIQSFRVEVRDTRRCDIQRPLGPGRAAGERLVLTVTAVSDT